MRISGVLIARGERRIGRLDRGNTWRAPGFPGAYSGRAALSKCCHRGFARRLITVLQGVGGGVGLKDAAYHVAISKQIESSSFHLPNEWLADRASGSMPAGHPSASFISVPILRGVIRPRREGDQMSSTDVDMIGDGTGARGESDGPLAGLGSRNETGRMGE
jgi:membrane-associated phospholipid phosphatase